jgi:hypothetical protein
MKFLVITLTAIVFLLVACKDISSKKDEVAAGSPTFQEIKKYEAQGDKAMPALVLYQKSMRDLLHSLEAANQTSDSTSMRIRKTLSELNKAENAFSSFKADFKHRLDTMPQEKRESYLSNSKADAMASTDMVLYIVKEAKRYSQVLRDKGVQILGLPQELPGE